MSESVKYSWSPQQHKQQIKTSIDGFYESSYGVTFSPCKRHTVLIDSSNVYSNHYPTSTQLLIGYYDEVEKYCS